MLFFFEANRTPKWKEKGDLNAGGQISLSCYIQTIKLPTTHSVETYIDTMEQMLKTRTLRNGTEWNRK